MKKYKIIDFHTHPFLSDETNICSHIPYCDMSVENTKKDLQSLGISKICGSVVKMLNKKPTPLVWADVQALNDEALKLREIYGDFYIPGFHVHPAFVKESVSEIERMNKLGVKLIGELVPYMTGWGDIQPNDNRFYEILEAAEHYGMVISYHSPSERDYAPFEEMIKRFPKLTVVAAHPQEYGGLLRQLDCMGRCDNMYLDVSGSGLFRHGMLRHGISEYGKERFLYGSDYPTCNPAMFIGGVADDFLLTDEEKEYVLHKNAERILKL